MTGSAELIGRGEELDRLRQWLSESLGGSPRVVVVTGDAGIGKSRLIAELIVEARDAGVRPFAGRALEGSSAPLLPFASLLDTLLPDLEPYRAGETSALVADVSRALMHAAADRPVLLVVEDVQWADEATLELLAHVAATLTHEAAFRGLPVLLLVTARAASVPPDASRLLSRLANESVGRIIRMRGLDDLDVFAFIAAQTEARPSVELLTIINEATQGNPHDIERMLAHLERIDALERRGRELWPRADVTASLPPESDDQLDDEGWSDAVRQLLITLALLRNGRIEPLWIASGLERDTFENALDEAIANKVLAEDGLRVEFVTRTTPRALLASIALRRQQQQHAAIAERLAAAADPRHVAANEIVGQLHRAGAYADTTLVARYARAAGEESLALSANADAARHFQAALEDDALDDVTRAELEQRAAVATYRCGDRDAAIDHAKAAIAIAERIGDLRLWGESALIGARAGFDTEPLERFLAAAGEAEPGLRSRAHGTIAEFGMDRIRLDVTVAHSAEAQRIAAESGETFVLAHAQFAEALQALGSLDLARMEELLERAEANARLAGDSSISTQPRNRRPLLKWAQGELDTAAAIATEAAEDTRTSSLWSEYSVVTATRVGVAVARGNLAAAERYGAEAIRAHERAEHVAVPGILWSALASARVLRGDAAGAYAALAKWERSDPRPAFLYGALIAAQTGEPHEGATWEPSALVHPSTPVNLSTVSMAAVAVELADALDRPELAVNAAEVLQRAYALGVRFVLGWSFFLPRLLGVAAALERDHTSALAMLGRAEAEARQIGAVGEAARSLYALGRVQNDVGAPEAAKTFDVAIDELERLGYRLVLDNACTAAGRALVRARASDEQRRVIVVTDLADSTPLAHRVGDHRFLELLREHNRIVRSRLRQFDGIEFKHTGDGIAAWFLTAGAAIECGLRIKADIEESNRSRADDPLEVRVGMAAGEVVTDGNDVFGIAVITAFRICDLARDGRILLAPELAEMLDHAAVQLAPLTDVVLKGFSEPQTLYAVASDRA